jgi:alcohol dehydrogenase
MQSFIFQNATKIIFGKETELTVGNELLAYSKKVLMHYGGGSIKRTGLYDRVCASLKEAGIEWVELSGVQPNPQLSMVNQGIQICRKENIDFILAVGGGSVIDSAKAIAMGVPYDGDVWDFFEGKEISQALPTAVILTIPATGSETSGASVITKEEGLYKRVVISALLRPKFSILNPELSLTLPVNQTMIGIADITAHMTERYFTQEPHVEVTDRLIEANLKTVIRNARILFRDPDNIHARAEIMWAGTLAHNDLLGTGRIPDWGSHEIEHELSAFYDVPHGAGLSVLIPAWMRYVYTENVQKFVQFGRRVFNLEKDFEFPEASALKAITCLKDFYKSIGLPVSLQDLEIPDDRLEEMATRCTQKQPLGNFKKLFKADVLSIFELAK